MNAVPKHNAGGILCDMDESAFDRVHRDARQLLDAVAAFGEHAQTEDVPRPGGGLRTTWKELSLDGRRCQARALRLLEEFQSVLSYLLRVPRGKFQSEVGLRCDTIRTGLQLTVPPPAVDPAYPDYFALTPQEVDALLRMVDATEDTGIRSVVVPDTSYLLNCPEIHKWRFDAREPVAVILVPPVLRELDEHIKGSNPKTRAAARSIRQQLRHLRTRGSLLDGVIVVSRRISLQVSAQEPPEDQIAPGLRSWIADDTIVACASELMRTHLRARVAIATDDQLMTYKAEAHRLSVVNPAPDEGDDDADAMAAPASQESGFEKKVEAELQRAYR